MDQEPDGQEGTGQGPTVVTVKFSTGASPLSVQIYVAFPGFPKDGSFAVQVPGTDSSNTISIPQIPIPSCADGLIWLVNYPANFATALTVNYWQGATTPPAGRQIVAQAQLRPEGGALAPAQVLDPVARDLNQGGSAEGSG